jgi:hypothetical protein
MKCKYGFLSAAFVAASLLLGSGDASAGGPGLGGPGIGGPGNGGGWWGRAGYGALRVREVHACIDAYTATMRVAFRAPGIRGHGEPCDLTVTADLFGDALCLLPPPPPAPPVLLPPPPPPIVGGCGGVILPPPGPGGLPLPPPPVVVPPPPPGPITVVTPFDGFGTDVDLAIWTPGNWLHAELDVLPLLAGACGPGDLGDLNIAGTTIFIGGRPFALDFVPPCDDGFYGDW